jgi:hypothetical protein
MSLVEFYRAPFPIPPISASQIDADRRDIQRANPPPLPHDAALTAKARISINPDPEQLLTQATHSNSGQLVWHSNQRCRTSTCPTRMRGTQIMLDYRAILSEKVASGCLIFSNKCEIYLSYRQEPIHTFLGDDPFGAPLMALQDANACCTSVVFYPATPCWRVSCRSCDIGYAYLSVPRDRRAVHIHDSEQRTGNGAEVNHMRAEPGSIFAPKIFAL